MPFPDRYQNDIDLMQCRRTGISGVLRIDVIAEAIKVPALLGSASVGVIVVVGNYLVAAFYEASGASTCHSGFHIPVETSAPPQKSLFLLYAFPAKSKPANAQKSFPQRCP